MTEEPIEVEIETVVEIEVPTGEVDEAQDLHESAERIERSVEALLFVATEPLDNKRLTKLTGADDRAVALAIQSLQQRYADRGILIRELAGGYRFATASMTRVAVEAYLLPPKTSLSVPALEALAIVAHMQPVTKGEIESIRGVNSDSVVNTLMDRNLIAEGGRKDVVGRPMQYNTTSFFLESFGLNALADLPQLELDPGQPLELNLLGPPGSQAELPVRDESNVEADSDNDGETASEDGEPAENPA